MSFKVSTNIRDLVFGAPTTQLFAFASPKQEALAEPQTIDKFTEFKIFKPFFVANKKMEELAFCRVKSVEVIKEEFEANQGALTVEYKRKLKTSLRRSKKMKLDT